MAKRLLRRLRADDGFGIIELSIAMVMLNVGILALVAGFNSGAVTLARTSKIANATVIADTYLERYRGYRNCQIYLDTSAPNGIPTTGTYATDSAYSATQITFNRTTQTQSYPPNDTTVAPILSSNDVNCHMDNGTAWPSGMSASQQAATTAHNASYVGPDNRIYIVDTYIVVTAVTGGGNEKKATVVVRDPSVASTPVLVRESTTFDPFDAP